MKQIGIAGIGVIGPGISNWEDAVAVLTGAEDFDPQAEVPTESPVSLPANERRRVTPLIRMVLQCCEDPLSGYSAEYPPLQSVFSSSCGGLETADKILRSLTLPHKPVSPTQFHNSVHNAPAGYWLIASGVRSGSISISAHDSSFGAGLLNAVSNVLIGDGPTLLVSYDYMAPPILRESRPYLGSFAVGLVLVDAPMRWTIEVDLRESDNCDKMGDMVLEAMRLGNPAARSLPLLARMAGDRPGQVRLPYLPNLDININVVRHARS